MPKRKQQPTIADMYDRKDDQIKLDEYGIEQQINVHDWLRLPAYIRGLFVDQFDIPRSTGTVVEDGHVSSDGHTYSDLSVINIGALQEFLGIEEPDFAKLIRLTAKRLEETAE